MTNSARTLRGRSIFEEVKERFRVMIVLLRHHMVIEIFHPLTIITTWALIFVAIVAAVRTTTVIIVVVIIMMVIVVDQIVYLLLLLDLLKEIVLDELV